MNVLDSEVIVGFQCFDFARCHAHALKIGEKEK